MRHLLLLLLLCSTASATDAALKVRLVVNQSLTTGVVAATAAIDHDNSDVFTSGTGAAQFQIVYSADVTGTTTALTDYDLVGVLKDAFGRTLTFTSIRGFYVEAASTNVGNILVGGGTHPVTSLFGDSTDIVVVRPGGVHYVVAMDSTGYAVTTGTADDIGIKASTGTVDYKIVVIGTGTAQ